MALTPATITSALRVAAPDFVGPTFTPFSIAIGTAVYSWAVVPANLALAGQTSGNAGTGTSTGFLTVPPDPLLAVNIFAAGGVVGPTGISLARAIGVGIPTAFLSAQYIGPSVGVSAGVDLSKVVLANPVTLIPLLLSNMQASFGGTLGPAAPQTATAIANAIVSLLLTGVTTPGTGIVVPVTPLAGPAVGFSPLSAVF